jgi:thiamine biosynthesis protein ThiI
MVAVGAASTMPIFRPLVGDDKQEILALARRIGTFDISSEPFHDCCPMFMPRSPALHASAFDLDRAETKLDVPALVRSGVDTAVLERYVFVGGRIERQKNTRTCPTPALEAS